MARFLPFDQTGFSRVKGTPTRALGAGFQAPSTKQIYDPSEHKFGSMQNLMGLIKGTAAIAEHPVTDLLIKGTGELVGALSPDKVADPTKHDEALRQIAELKVQREAVGKAPPTEAPAQKPPEGEDWTEFMIRDAQERLRGKTAVGPLPEKGAPEAPPITFEEKVKKNRAEIAHLKERQRIDAQIDKWMDIAGKAGREIDRSLGALMALATDPNSNEGTLARALELADEYAPWPSVTQLRTGASPKMEWKKQIINAYKNVHAKPLTAKDFHKMRMDEKKDKRKEDKLAKQLEWLGVKIQRGEIGIKLDEDKRQDFIEKWSRGDMKEKLDILKAMSYMYPNMSGEFRTAIQSLLTGLGFPTLGYTGEGGVGGRRRGRGTGTKGRSKRKMSSDKRTEMSDWLDGMRDQVETLRKQAKDPDKTVAHAAIGELNVLAGNLKSVFKSGYASRSDRKKGRFFIVPDDLSRRAAKIAGIASSVKDVRKEERKEAAVFLKETRKQQAKEDARAEEKKAETAKRETATKEQKNQYKRKSESLARLLSISGKEIKKLLLSKKDITAYETAGKAWPKRLSVTRDGNHHYIKGLSTLWPHKEKAPGYVRNFINTVRGRLNALNAFTTRYDISGE
jgi:hypothetical protein